MVSDPDPGSSLNADENIPDERDVVEITLTEAVSNEPIAFEPREEWVTLKEAAERVSVSVSTLRRWYRQGEIDSRLEPGPRGDRRVVPMSQVSAKNSKKAGATSVSSGEVLEPREAEPAVPSSSPPAQSDQDVLPIRRSAWEKLLQQLGNLHEAGQQLAEARERAARAEERYAFEVERRKLLESRVADLEKLQQSAAVERVQAQEENTGTSPSESSSRSEEDTGATFSEPSIASQPPVASPEPELGVQPDPDEQADAAPEQEDPEHASPWSSVPIVILDSERAKVEAESAARATATWWQRSLNRIKEVDLDAVSRDHAMRWRKQHKSVLGLRMAYVEAGKGDPIVFLHGNPTSSYLWRNIMPYLQGHGRVIAPDLIGMGDSEKLFPSGPNSYTFADHRTYLDALFVELGVTDNVTLVVHELGSGLGFDWANRNRAAVKGIAYMEAIVGRPSWDDWPENATHIFKAMRSDVGDQIALTKNLLIEQFLPASILRDLTEVEMKEYRRPFVESGEARRPMLTWPRQIPFDGEPANVDAVVAGYSAWLATGEVPKLFINAEPGSILTGRQRELCRSWLNQTEVTVRGLHFVQEDSPDEIGAAIADWYTKL